MNAAALAAPKSSLKLVSADSNRFRNPRGRRPLQEARVGEADEGVERVAEDRGESEAALFVERGADGVSETFRDQYCKTFLCRSWWYCVKVGFALSSTASLLRFMQSQVIFWQKCKKTVTRQAPDLFAKVWILRLAGYLRKLYIYILGNLYYSSLPRQKNQMLTSAMVKKFCNIVPRTWETATRWPREACSGGKELTSSRFNPSSNFYETIFKLETMNCPFWRFME